MQAKTNQTYELDIEGFKGPLEKLSELIETRRLEITRVSLASVTADFLRYVEGLEGRVDRSQLANFVVVAAKLILIKSQALLPHLKLSGEEEQDIRDLEERLKVYKRVREAEKGIQKLWGAHPLVSRPFLSGIPSVFSLTERVGPGDLRPYLEATAQDLMRLTKLSEEEVKLVSLEEKIGELVKSVGEKIKTTFSELQAGKDRSEIVILFLALLHLLKDARIDVSQEGLFSEIEIQNNHA